MAMTLTITTMDTPTSTLTILGTFLSGILSRKSQNIAITKSACSPLGLVAQLVAERPP